MSVSVIPPRGDDQPADGRVADLPFALTPHLVRIPAKGKQTLRLLYEGIGMPQDRESRADRPGLRRCFRQIGRAHV